jgi:hypothetical protein
MVCKKITDKWAVPDFFKTMTAKAAAASAYRKNPVTKPRVLEKKRITVCAIY